MKEDLVRTVTGHTHVQVQERFGTEVIVLRETEEADLDLDHLEEVLQAGPGSRGDGAGFTLVSISHIPTSSGRVYDAEGVGRIVSHFPGPRTAGPPSSISLRSRLRSDTLTFTGMEQAHTAWTASSGMMHLCTVVSFCMLGGAQAWPP
jgi:hypothetical protein